MSGILKGYAFYNLHRSMRLNSKSSLFAFLPDSDSFGTGKATEVESERNEERRECRELLKRKNGK